jgi:uncharacterized membrane protein (UPF0182 family)
MDTNLEAALEGLFGSGAAPSGKPAATAKATPAALTPASIPGTSAPSVLAKQALDHFNKAQAALRDQDWTRYGEELKKMRATLEELAKR